MALYILVYLISLLDKLQALTGTALVLSGQVISQLPIC